MQRNPQKMAKSIKDQLNAIIASKVKMKNGETLQEQLAREVRRLYDCIQYYIDSYYDSYEPKVYRRTWRFHGALYAEDFVNVRIVGNTIRLSVKFNDDLVMHDNFVGGKSYIAPMLNWGWNAPKLAAYIGRNVYRLTYFEGAHFIEDGIRLFNRSNSLGIKIHVDAIHEGIPIYNRTF